MIDLVIVLMQDYMLALLSVIGVTKVSMISYVHYAIVSAIMAKESIPIFRKRISRSKLFVIVFAVVSVLGYLLTRINYNYTSSLYRYRFLYQIVFCCLPIIAGYARGRKESIGSIERWAPVFAIVLTMGALFATLFSSGTTNANMIGGTYIQDDSGLNYQRVSYLGAYAFGILFYCINNYNRIEKIRFFSTKIGKPLMVLLAVIDWIVILLSGGKGGFVTAAVFFVIEYFGYAINNTKSVKIILKRLLTLVIIIIIGIFVVRYVSRTSLTISGFKRIQQFLATGDSTGRFVNNYKPAITSFKKSPIIGHGIGSVYYECPPYSHLFFLDVLVETGIIGIIFWLSVFAIIGRKYFRIKKKNRRFGIIGILFLTGFIHGLFSGYYLEHVSIFWAMGYILSAYRNKKYRQDIKNKEIIVS